MRGSVFALALLATSPAVAAGDGKFSISTGFDYSAGDYGEAIDTETWSLPVNFKYKNGPLTFKINTSYLWVNGPQNVTPEGDPLPGNGVKRVEHGPGDITAYLIVSTLEEDRNAVDLELAGKIKFGTADPDKALGTGENDYSLQASLYKTLGSWGPYLDIGYRWKGDPEGIDYDDVWFATAGGGVRLNKTWTAGADYSWRDRLTPRSAPLSEATIYANYRVNDQDRMNIYGVAGFSDASPDWGIGLTVSRTF